MELLNKVLEKLAETTDKATSFINDISAKLTGTGIIPTKASVYEKEKTRMKKTIEASERGEVNNFIESFKTLTPDAKLQAYNTVKASIVNSISSRETQPILKTYYQIKALQRLAGEYPQIKNDVEKFLPENLVKYINDPVKKQSFINTIVRAERSDAVINGIEKSLIISGLGSLALLPVSVPIATAVGTATGVGFVLTRLYKLKETGQSLKEMITDPGLLFDVATAYTPMKVSKAVSPIEKVKAIKENQNFHLDITEDVASLYLPVEEKKLNLSKGRYVLQNLDKAEKTAGISVAQQWANKVKEKIGNVVGLDVKTVIDYHKDELFRFAKNKNITEGFTQYFKNRGVLTGDTADLEGFVNAVRNNENEFKIGDKIIKITDEDKDIVNKYNFWNVSHRAGQIFGFAREKKAEKVVISYIDENESEKFLEFSTKGEDFHSYLNSVNTILNNPAITSVKVVFETPEKEKLVRVIRNNYIPTHDNFLITQGKAVVNIKGEEFVVDVDSVATPMYAPEMVKEFIEKEVREKILANEELLKRFSQEDLNNFTIDFVKSEFNSIVPASSVFPYKMKSQINKLMKEANKLKSDKSFTKLEASLDAGSTKLQDKIQKELDSLKQSLGINVNIKLADDTQSIKLRQSIKEELKNLTSGLDEDLTKLFYIADNKNKALAEKQASLLSQKLDKVFDELPDNDKVLSKITNKQEKLIDGIVNRVDRYVEKELSLFQNILKKNNVNLSRVAGKLTPTEKTLLKKKVKEFVNETLKSTSKAFNKTVNKITTSKSWKSTKTIKLTEAENKLITKTASDLERVEKFLKQANLPGEIKIPLLNDIVKLKNSVNNLPQANIDELKAFLKTLNNSKEKLKVLNEKLSSIKTTKQDLKVLHNNIKQLINTNFKELETISIKQVENLMASISKDLSEAQITTVEKAEQLKTVIKQIVNDRLTEITSSVGKQLTKEQEKVLNNLINTEAIVDKITKQATEDISKVLAKHIESVIKQHQKRVGRIEGKLGKLEELAEKERVKTQQNIDKALSRLEETQSKALSRSIEKIEQAEEKYDKLVEKALEKYFKHLQQTGAKLETLAEGLERTRLLYNEKGYNFARTGRGFAVKFSSPEMQEAYLLTHMLSSQLAGMTATTSLRNLQQYINDLITKLGKENVNSLVLSLKNVLDLTLNKPEPYSLHQAQKILGNLYTLLKPSIALSNIITNFILLHKLIPELDIFKADDFGKALSQEWQRLLSSQGIYSYNKYNPALTISNSVIDAHITGNLKSATADKLIAIANRVATLIGREGDQDFIKTFTQMAKERPDIATTQILSLVSGVNPAVMSKELAEYSHVLKQVVPWFQFITTPFTASLQIIRNWSHLDDIAKARMLGKGIGMSALGFAFFEEGGIPELAPVETVFAGMRQAGALMTALFGFNPDNEIMSAIFKSDTPLRDIGLELFIQDPKLKEEIVKGFGEFIVKHYIGDDDVFGKTLLVGAQIFDAVGRLKDYNIISGSAGSVYMDIPTPIVSVVANLGLAIKQMGQEQSATKSIFNFTESIIPVVKNVRQAIFGKELVKGLYYEDSPLQEYVKELGYNRQEDFYKDVGTLYLVGMLTKFADATLDNNLLNQSLRFISDIKEDKAGRYASKRDNEFVRKLDLSTYSTYEDYKTIDFTLEKAFLQDKKNTYYAILTKIEQTAEKNKKALTKAVKDYNTNEIQKRYRALTHMITILAKHQDNLPEEKKEALQQKTRGAFEYIGNNKKNSRKKRY